MGNSPGAVAPPPPPGFQLEQPAGAAPPPPDGFVPEKPETSSLMGSISHGAGEFVKSLWDSGKGLASIVATPPQTMGDKAAALLGPVGVPIKRSLEGYYEAVRHHLDAAEAASKSGDSAGALLHSVAAGLPLVGPLMGDTYETAKSGDLAGAIGKGAAGIAQAASMAPEGSSIPNPLDVASKVAAPAAAKAASAGGFASDVLRESASKDLEQVLGATKQKMKAAASENVVPGMIDRGMTGMSRQDLLNQANKIIADNGPKVGAALDEATKNGITFPTKPLIDRLEQIRDDHQVRNAKGEVTAVRPEAMNMIDGLKETLDKYGNSINPQEMANLRRFWDQDVANSTKGFLLDQPQAALDVKRATTNALRATINDNLPDVAAANKEYSFGQDLKSVLEATMQRQASQSGILGKTLRSGKGAAIGGSIGGLIGGPPGAAAGGMAGGAIATLMDTTVWKTLSAAQKTKIASALADESPAASTPRLGPGWARDPITGKIVRALPAAAQNQLGGQQ